MPKLAGRISLSYRNLIESNSALGLVFSPVNTWISQFGRHPLPLSGTIPNSIMILARDPHRGRIETPDATPPELLMEPDTRRNQLWRNTGARMRLFEAENIDGQNPRSRLRRQNGGRGAYGQSRRGDP